MSRILPRLRVAAVTLAAAAVAGGGCQGVGDLNTVPGGPPTPIFGGDNRGPGPGQSPYIRPAPKAPAIDDSQLPKELNKVTMPPYTVEVRDLLLIDSQRIIPLPPYVVQPLDVLYINVPESNVVNKPELLINGPYTVDPDGTINLGPTYGAPIRVADLTVPEIEKVLEARLKTTLTKTGGVFVSLAQARGAQQIRGEHLVRPDGTVALGLYGSVYVAGMTTAQVKQAVEAHLARFLYKPEVSVDVAAYNSKYYFVITDYAGSGEQVVKFPHTGNETVLEAIANVGGLSSVSSKTVWIARPAPAGTGDQILPVDWKGITRRGNTRSNYQVLPGDRVFVMGQPLTKVDTVLARALAPVERTLGIALLARSLDRGFGFGGGGGGQTTVNVAPAGTTPGTTIGTTGR